MEGLSRDLRYAIRTLGRSRVFTAGVILTLALAISVATVVLSTADRILWRPIDAPESDRFIHDLCVRPLGPVLLVSVLSRL